MNSIGFIVVMVILPSVYSTRYDGDEVLEVFVKTDAQMKTFNETLQHFQNRVSVWQPPVASTGAAHVHVENEDKRELKNRLKDANIPYRVLIKDVQKNIDNERMSNPSEGVALPWDNLEAEGGRRNRRRRWRRADAVPSNGSSIVGRYATYDEIRDWLYDLERTFPDLAEVKVIGKTFQGRDLLLLKIGYRNSTTPRPGIWVDAGTHAREWITVSSAVYIISQILTNFWAAKEDLPLIGDVDWYIVPLVNPDGYAHTQAINGTRLWRKNRSVYNTSYSTHYNMSCRGTDINRNFGFHWGEIGAGADPCLETYRGPWAMSENETRAIADFLSAHDDSVRGYVTIHSYGQLFLVRWAYSLDAPHTPEFNQTIAVASEAVSAINASSGIVYRAGTSPELLYEFGGGSGDWVRANTAIRHAYDVELRDRGDFGFLLPANYVLPVGEEIWQAVKVVATHVLEDYRSIETATTTTDMETTTTDTQTTTTDIQTTTADIQTTTTVHTSHNTATKFHMSVFFKSGCAVIFYLLYFVLC